MPLLERVPGLNGWVMFCSAGAFARKLTREEAESCGCTDSQRETCKKVMESYIGYSVVPEITDPAAVEVTAKTSGREPVSPGR